jgi:hypothetical protein
MSNVSTNNLAVSGTCAISGTVSLSQPLISGSTASYQGITTTDLTTTGNVIFNTLPVSNVVPTLSNNLTNKAYVDVINSIQNGRLDGIDALNVVQDGRITAEEVKTQNISFAANRTTINGVSTTVGIMTHTVPPVSATLPTSATQVSNKQYVDNNIQIVNNSILVTNNAATALTTRVGTLETKNTNISYAAGSNTTSISGATAFLNAPTISATSTSTNSVQTKAYIDAQDLIATNAITAVQTVNNTQNSEILTLQQKTSAIVYSNPVAGQLTEIGSSVSILPYNNTTFLKSFSLSCNNIICFIQATFGGSGANQGITTSQLTVGGFGNTFKTVYFGSVTSVSGTNTVTFTTAMIGTIPKILLTPLGTSTGIVLTNKTLTGFTFTATGVFNVDWIAIQPL